MSKAVKVMVSPTGERFVTNEDDARAKAEALRLGLLPSITAALRKHEGRQRCASGLVRDGDRLVAIIAWQGFASEKDNGWISVTATPACEKTADKLVELARQLTNATSIRFVEGGAPWN